MITAIITLLALWLVSVIIQPFTNIQFFQKVLFTTELIQIRVYQEPERSRYEFGIDTTMGGWKNPLFNIHILYWSIDLEIDFFEKG